MTPQFNLLGNRRGFIYTAFDRAMTSQYAPGYKLKLELIVRRGGSAGIVFTRLVGLRHCAEN